MKQKVNYLGAAALLALGLSFGAQAQRQISNKVTDRIYKRDVQERRQRLPNIINTLLHDEYSPAISHDGKTLVYQTNRGGKAWSNFGLWESKKDTVTGFWMEPAKIESINMEAGGPFIAYDGSMLLFHSVEGETADIYMAKKEANGSWGAPAKVGGAVNTGDFEGFPSLSSDGQRLYFVRKGDAKRGIQCFKLMVSKADMDGNFGAAEELPSPVNAGCESHVRILPDNETVIFSSTRRGGSPKRMNDMDLYYSHMNAGGAWEEPKPADIEPLVRTNLYSYQPEALVSIAMDDEPHVLAYFTAYQGASYELFTVPLPDGMKPKRTCHFQAAIVDGEGKPVEGDVVIKIDNETRPSLSYAKKADANKRFSTVITEGNKYKFTVEVQDAEPVIVYSDLTNGFDPGDCEKTIVVDAGNVKATIAVIDGLTRDAIENGMVNISSKDPKGKVTDQKKIGPGKYEAKLRINANYCAQGTADQYKPAIISIDLSNKKAGDTINREIMLYDLSKIVFDNINFITARPRNTTPRELEASLQPKARAELDKVLKFLQDYPTVNVSIEGHTDFRGGDEFNQALSQRRTEAAKYYLMQKGIAESRLVAKGFGEASPLVPNEVNGRQNAANMALNRRVEFKVVQKDSDDAACK
ncbi:MAG: OmpA family protein [Bernardetiaceae bacterium]|nr:OmpA family protein [Bernardetiaceae bacterium]